MRVNVKRNNYWGFPFWLLVISTFLMTGCGGVSRALDACPSAQDMYPLILPGPVTRDTSEYTMTTGINFGSYEQLIADEKVPYGFVLEIKNKTNSTMRILWDNSVLSKDGSSRTIYPALESVTQGDKNETIIPPHKTHRGTFNLDNVYDNRLIEPANYSVYIELKVNKKRLSETMELSIRKNLKQSVPTTPRLCQIDIKNKYYCKENSSCELYY